MKYLRKICFLAEHEKRNNIGKSPREAAAGQLGSLTESAPEKTDWEKTLSGEGVLCVCDDGERAKKLSEAGIPVMAYLHEGSREQDFSGIKYAAEHPEELDESYFEKIYRRIKGIPWEILTTERCVIRETVVEDADAFFEIYANPQITKYTAFMSLESGPYWRKPREA